MFCLDLKIWQALRKESKINKIQNQVAPAEEAALTGFGKLGPYFKTSGLVFHGTALASS